MRLLWVRKRRSISIKTLPGNDRFCVDNGHARSLRRLSFIKLMMTLMADERPFLERQPID